MKGIVAPLVKGVFDPFLGGRIKLPGDHVIHLPEAGIAGNIGIDGRHHHVVLAVEPEGFAKGVLRAEKRFGGRLGKHDGGGLLQPVFIAPQDFEGKHIHNPFLHGIPLPGDFGVAHLQVIGLLPRRHHYMLEIVAVLFADLKFQRPGNGAAGPRIAVEGLALVELGDPVPVFEMGVVGELVVHPEADQQGHGHAGGQPQDVDGGIDLVLPEVAPGDFKVVLKHGDCFLIRGLGPRLMNKLRRLARLSNRPARSRSLSARRACG